MGSYVVRPTYRPACESRWYGGRQCGKGCIGVSMLSGSLHFRILEVFALLEAIATRRFDNIG